MSEPMQPPRRNHGCRSRDCHSINDGEIARRCRHFRNDRPCLFHKEQGLLCSSCPHKDLIAWRILLIKLDAPGDVLRTTCLLPSLREHYPSSQITWVTREAARPLLEHNPYIDRLVDGWEEVFTILQTEHFDLAINPDASPQAARLLQMASADEKRGMGWSAAGHVICYNQEAETWFRLGLDDAAKKANQQTYQYHLHRLCGLELIDPRPRLHLTETERTFAASHLVGLGVDLQKPVIGLNLSAGNRWPLKSWSFEHQVRFIQLLKCKQPHCQLLLFGGPDETERNRKLLHRCSGLLTDVGQHPLRQFAALLGLTHLLLTADTLALHIGLALGRPILALFGPTSPAEIDLCGGGEKLAAELDCLVCYRTACDKSPNCMDLLTPEMVLASTEALLQKIQV